MAKSTGFRWPARNLFWKCVKGVLSNWYFPRTLSTLFPWELKSANELPSWPLHGCLPVPILWRERSKRIQHARMKLISHHGMKWHCIWTLAHLAWSDEGQALLKKYHSISTKSDWLFFVDYGPGRIQHSTFWFYPALKKDTWLFMLASLYISRHVARQGTSQPAHGSNSNRNWKICQMIDFKWFHTPFQST